MISHETKVRVRYAETDQMGYLHHGRYAQFYELARIEMLRAYGLSYKELEAQGVLLPVASIQSDFHAPAFYDDELCIKTTLHALPTVKMKFCYEIFNQEGKKINSGATTLVFVDAKTRRPMRPPAAILDVLRDLM